ncbi:MAG: hypothetical protein KBA71_09140 [Opitutaceae bacterium]|nr:hypothetical protein [Opitutaceae bacterium]
MPSPTRPRPSSALPLVLVTSSTRREDLAPLLGKARLIMGPGGGDTMSRKEILKHAPKLFAIICRGELLVDAEILESAPNLRIVASASVGVDKLDLSRMEAQGVFATNAPDYFVEATADYAMGAMISLLRRLPEADRYVRTGRWRSFQPGAWDGSLLRGKVLGLVGFGAIGRAVARRAEAFGLTVIHYRRTASQDSGYTPLPELLARSDIVSLHVPLNQESRTLINAARIRQMKKGAYLINVSRGPVVDEPALISALESGRLAGAALDVFTDEPRVPQALRRLPNTLLTPHLGGGTVESRRHSSLTCATAVARVLSGHHPENLKNNPSPKSLRKWRIPAAKGIPTR